MTLVCTKCGCTEAERDGYEIHCRFCGNVAVDGVNARWPFKEREIEKETGATQEIMAEGSICPTAAKNLSNNGQSPLQLAQGIREKEADMSKKKCSIPGCEKVSWIEGLCHRHYTEKNGEYIPKKRYLPRSKKNTSRSVPETKRALAETKKARGETKAQDVAATRMKKVKNIPCPFTFPIDGGGELPCLEMGDVAVIVKFTGHDQLLEALRILAKKEFRNIDAQILYMIDQYFNNPPTILSASLEACHVGVFQGCDKASPGAKDA